MEERQGAGAPAACGGPTQRRRGRRRPRCVQLGGGAGAAAGVALAALALSSSLSFVAANCPNNCSTGADGRPHGECDQWGQCTCYSDWTGADCSLRTCPKGLAWADVATADDTAHASVECSNMGICNRKTGACACREGFEGQACERMACAVGSTGGTCSGHGKCVSMQQAAMMNDGWRFNTTTALSDFATTDHWEAQKIFGCACDRGFTGNDCSERECPVGQPWDSNLALAETARVVCTCNTGCAGSFRLKFRGKRATVAWNATPATLAAALMELTTVHDVPADATSFKPIAATVSAGTTVCSGDGTAVTTTVTFTGEPGDVPPLYIENVKLTDTAETATVAMQTKFVLTCVCAGACTAEAVSLTGTWGGRSSVTLTHASADIDVKSAVQGLPGLSTVDATDITVTFSAGTTICTAAGGTVTTTVTFPHTFGNYPVGVVSSTTGAVLSVTTYDGSTPGSQCAGAGGCDTTIGKCVCAEGYGYHAGYGDCSGIAARAAPWHGLEMCPGPISLNHQYLVDRYPRPVQYFWNDQGKPVSLVPDPNVYWQSEDDTAGTKVTNFATTDTAQVTGAIALDLSQGRVYWGRSTKIYYAAVPKNLDDATIATQLTGSTGTLFADTVTDTISHLALDARPDAALRYAYFTTKSTGSAPGKVLRRLLSTVGAPALVAGEDITATINTKLAAAGSSATLLSPTGIVVDVNDNTLFIADAGANAAIGSHTVDGALYRCALSPTDASILSCAPLVMAAHGILQDPQGIALDMVDGHAFIADPAAAAVVKADIADISGFLADLNVTVSDGVNTYWTIASTATTYGTVYRTPIGGPTEDLTTVLNAAIPDIMESPTALVIDTITNPAVPTLYLLDAGPHADIGTGTEDGALYRCTLNPATSMSITACVELTTLTTTRLKDPTSLGLQYTLNGAGLPAAVNAAYIVDANEGLVITANLTDTSWVYSSFETVTVTSLFDAYEVITAVDANTALVSPMAVAVDARPRAEGELATVYYVDSGLEGLYSARADGSEGKFIFDAGAPIGLAVDWGLGAPRASTGWLPCSGHGTCGGAPRFQCTCHPGWTGAGCERAPCPVGPAWFDEPDEFGGGHRLAECSARGACDRDRGACVCQTGFEGPACERLSCPSLKVDEETSQTCGGHGRCLTMRELALTAVDADTLNPSPHDYPSIGGTRKDTWDGDMVQGCLCDAPTYRDGAVYKGPSYHRPPAYAGYDCSLRACPTGNNPNFSRGDAVPWVQKLTCAAGATGTFTLTFRGATSAVLDATSVTRGGVRSALLSLNTIGDVEVYVQTVGSPLDYDGDGNAIALTDTAPFCDGKTLMIHFKTEQGTLPDIEVATLSGAQTITVAAPMQQVLTCTTPVTASDTFTLSFKSTVAATLNALTVTRGAIVTALNGLGNMGTIEVHEADGDTEVLASATALFCGSAPLVINFKTELGAMPTIVVARVAGANPSPVTAMAVTPPFLSGHPQYETDTKQMQRLTRRDECSGKGVCDPLTGGCRCFDGWTSSDGWGEIGPRRDCGFFAGIDYDVYLQLQKKKKT